MGQTTPPDCVGGMMVPIQLNSWSHLEAEEKLPEIAEYVNLLAKHDKALTA
jgi:hypothetical protein